MLVDVLWYYMFVGLVVNWIIALHAVLTNPYNKIDIAGFIITIPAWPLTLYSIIAEFFDNR